MIVVETRSGQINIVGHAYYAEPGKDIVCAAVTALVQSLISSLEELTDSKIEYELSPGKAVINYKELSADAKLLISSFFLGLKVIEEQFPDNLKIAQAWKA